jgi:hypothetical protein
MKSGKRLKYLNNNQRNGYPIVMYGDKTIKAYNTKRFKVELYETTGNSYIIKYENTYSEAQYSEVLNDYNMASYLFDLKIDELEGN